jgi:hypothetical protein
MKKMMVSLMLILSMFAFAAESAPSATVGYVKYSNVITAGTDFNFMALPVNAGYTNVSTFDLTGTNINSISKWNASTQAWVTATRGAFGWSGDYAAVIGEAYYVNAKITHDFIMDGSVVAIPAYNFVITAGTDFNNMMVPLTEPTLTTTALLGADIVNTNSISKYTASTQSWTTSAKGAFGWSNIFATAIADPLRINVTANTTWPTGKAIEAIEGETPSAPKADPKVFTLAVKDYTGAYYADDPPTANVTFKAWVTARPTEVLQEFTPSCSFMYYFVCGAVSINAQGFTTPWADGNILRVLAKDEDQVPPMEGTIDITFAGGGDPQDIGFEDWIPGTGAALVLGTPSSIENSSVPTATKLHQNYPNPFNPTTTIKFDLATNSNVKLNVYNYNGQLVKSLVNGTMNAGYHAVDFDASSLSAGVYYYTMETAGKSMTQKMVLVK